MSNQTAKFVEGSTMRHILVMSGAGSVGLMALFVVDLLDMLFISMLGQVELAAAVGFAGTLTFFLNLCFNRYLDCNGGVSFQSHWSER